MEQKKRKLIRMLKALTPRDNTNIHCASRKAAGKTNIEDCVDISIHQKYIKKSIEKLITAADNSNGNIGTKSKEKSRK